jgi:hypothetical protein
MLGAVVRAARRGACKDAFAAAKVAAVRWPRAFVAARSMATTPEMTVREALNSAIDEEMERDPMVWIMGA